MYTYIDSELHTMNAIGIPVCTCRSLTRMVNKKAEAKASSSCRLGLNDFTTLWVESMHTMLLLLPMIYHCQR